MTLNPPTKTDAKKSQPLNTESPHSHTHCDHSHDHSHDQIEGHHHHVKLEHNDNTFAQRVFIVFLINLLFALIEIFGSFYAQSVAIFADAWHDLGDALALFFVWYLFKVSQNYKKENYPYGPERLSHLGSLLTAVILILGSLYAIYESFTSLVFTHSPQPQFMIYLALLGVTINLAALFFLSKGHTHSEKILSWHMIEDILNWVAVLVGASLIYFFDWTWIDPVLALGVAVFILKNTWPLLLQSLDVLLQKWPKNIKLSELKSFILENQNILDVKEIKVWSLDTEKLVMSSQIIWKTNDLFLRQSIKTQLKQSLQLRWNIVDCVFESTENESDVIKV